MRRAGFKKKPRWKANAAPIVVDRKLLAKSAQIKCKAMDQFLFVFPIPGKHGTDLDAFKVKDHGKIRSLSTMIEELLRKYPRKPRRR